MTMTLIGGGTTGGHCELTVGGALRGVSGVTDVTVNRKGERASVDGDADATALVETVEDAGDTAHVRE